MDKLERNLSNIHLSNEFTPGNFVAMNDKSEGEASSHSQLPIMSSTAYTHQGDLPEIPVSASIGLQFLQHLLPLLDSLEPNAFELRKLFSPKARIRYNGHDVGTIDQTYEMRAKRIDFYQLFKREVIVAWEIENPKRKDQSMLIVESVTTCILRDDGMEEQLKAKEFNTIEIHFHGNPDHKIPYQPGSCTIIDFETLSDPTPVFRKLQQLGELREKIHQAESQYKKGDEKEGENGKGEGMEPRKANTEMETD